MLRMEYALVSATAREIMPLLEHLGADHLPEGQPTDFQLGERSLTVLITGVGMMQAAFHTGRLLARRSFGHAVQAGVAGAFDRGFSLGTVVEVVSQQYGDLGFPHGNAFTDVFDMGLSDPGQAPFSGGKVLNTGHTDRWHPDLPAVSAISVNAISSEAGRITALHEKYGAQVEVMEGLGFHYACRFSGQAYSEVRALSNYVEPRNRSAWKLEAAVAALNGYLLDWLSR